MARTCVGRFVDVAGLDFRSGSLEGTTNTDGEFQYEENGQVSFYIGPLHLGTTYGKPIVTILDCVEKTDAGLDDPKLLNRARLLFSLTSGLGFEKGIVIDKKVNTTFISSFQKLEVERETRGCHRFYGLSPNMSPS